MSHYRSIRRIVLSCTFVVASMGSTLCFVHNAAAQSQAAADLGYYLHYKTGMHDYMYGPGGIVPRYLGLPAQEPTYGQLPSRTRVIVIHVARSEALNLQVTMPSKSWTTVDPWTIGSRQLPAHPTQPRSHHLAGWRACGRRSEGNEQNLVGRIARENENDPRGHCAARRVASVWPEHPRHFLPRHGRAGRHERPLLKLGRDPQWICVQNIRVWRKKV